MHGPVIDVSGVVDHQPIRGVTWTVFALCFTVMLSEGYNLGVIGYAAPGILKSFGIARAQMAPIFSMALFGMLVGSLGAGIIGDRYGRKRGLIFACLIIGIASLGCAAAAGLQALLWMRLVVGLGLGGLIPNVSALMAEFMPQKVRGAFSTFAFMGITFGGMLPGLLAAVLPGSEWRALFLVGGFIPLVAIPVLLAFLPESIKFLALRGIKQDQLRKLLSRVDPGLPVPENARFVLNEARSNSPSFRVVFAGKLRGITLFLWICFISIMLVNFFINSWLTLMLHDLGFSAAEAAGTASLYYAGGICGGLIVGPALDRYGLLTLVANTLLGAFIASLIGVQGTSHAMIHVLVFFVGFSVLGSQVGMSSTAGMLYPTAVRSKGVGLAHSVGRLGAMSGPLLAGVLMSNDASPFVLFLVPIVPLLAASLSFLTITRLWTGRLRGVGFRQLHEATS